MLSVCAGIIELPGPACVVDADGKFTSDVPEYAGR